MAIPELPLLLEPEQLEGLLRSPEQLSSLLIVDLCRHETYAQAHIPGAVHLDYSQIVTMKKPVMGLIPDNETLNQLFSSIGLSPEKHIIAYDDEGGGRAARLIWTLDAIGFHQASMLNGGLHAWVKEKHPYVNTEDKIAPGNFHSTIDMASDSTPVADKNYILKHLDDANVVFLDARSPEEYRGEKKFAARAGRIPGSVNVDWMLLIDQTNNMRLKPEDELRSILNEHGITTDKKVVTYCQTHHRSALSYFVLRLLGYKQPMGYHGSWSDWGNCEDTPIETG